MLRITTDLKSYLQTTFKLSATASDDEARLLVSNKIVSGELSTEKLAQLTDTKAATKALVREAMREELRGSGGSSGPTPADVFGAAAGNGNGNGYRVDVKDASGRYSMTKSVGRHIRTGQPVIDYRGKQVELLSEFECAKAGALLKWRAKRAGISVDLSEHDQALVEECFQKDLWVRDINGQLETGIDGMRAKALLSDATSGGSELNPAWFDDAITVFPLLYGELVPMVDNKNVPRGNAVESASIGNPTVQWGVAEGTAMTLFDTTALVAEINTSLFPITCAVEVGRDMLADAAAEVGQILVSNIGQRVAAELDKVVAVGDGTTQPQGIFTASGIASVTSANGGSGPPTLADYESLMFAVGKQYRSNASLSPAFVSNDTSFARAQGMKTDSQSPSSNEQRLLGMNYAAYSALGHPWKVQNDIPNTKAAFGAMKKYRLYRREGTETRWVDGGKTLALANLVLLVVRGRYGGRVMDANAFAKITTGQS